MNRDSVDWWGPMPAAVTPFGADGAIDSEAFHLNAERMLSNGATGMVVGGCTGEFWALSTSERCALYEIGAKSMAGKGTVIAGTGAITVDETVALTKAAKAAGCDGALILPPYFVQLTDDEIFGHFQAVDDAVAFPIIVYNIPVCAVNAITPELASRLADLDNVVAIKESSGDWNNFYSTLIKVIDRIRVFCGPSSIFGVPALAAGADGFIDCFPNLWSPGGLDLFHAAKAGRMDEANRLQQTGRLLTDLFTSGGRTLYPATKAAMNEMGYAGGEPRSPLLPLRGEALDGLLTGLRKLNLL